MRRWRPWGGGCVVVGVLLWMAACVPAGAGGGRAPAKAKPITVMAGTQIPTLALAFDVSYDPATDRVVPGYRILQVAIKNNSLNLVQLDPIRDRWTVVDRQGRKRKAIIDLRKENPDVWSQLPPRLRLLIEYPLLVEIGTTQALDLLIPTQFPLNEFRSVLFESAGLGGAIEIHARDSAAN